MARSSFVHLDREGRAQVVAHRGASRAARENTLEAFAKARALRADAVELDVRRSADGALVVHHDAALEGLGVLAHVEFERLRTHAPWVPTLEEAFEACGGLWVNVEVKNLPIDADWDESESVATRVAELVKARSLHERTLVSSFNPMALARVREVDVEIATALLAVGGVDPVTVVETAAAAGHVAVHPEVGGLIGDAGSRALDRADALDLAVVPWTVDDPDEMVRLVGLGVAGVITNVPDVARRALGG